jgi:hypothetical protein
MCPAPLLGLGVQTSASFILKFSFLLWPAGEAREGVGEPSLPVDLEDAGLEALMFRLCGVKSR